MHFHCVSTIKKDDKIYFHKILKSYIDGNCPACTTVVNQKGVNKMEDKLKIFEVDSLEINPPSALMGK